MKKPHRSFARIGIVETYLEIALDSYLDYKKQEIEYNKIISEGGEMHEGSIVYKRMDDYFYYLDCLRKDTIKIIVFLTTFLESYINDLGGMVLGDNFLKEHLDKLSITGKWIIISKLITGTEIDISKSFWKEFKELIKWRNILVHQKTKDASRLFESPNDKDIEAMKPINELYDVSKGFKMIKELFIELDRIDEQGGHFFRIEMTLKKIK
jgi:hypothetical protein